MIDTRQRIFGILGASSGNLLEWFNLYVFMFCAIYFAPAFFPKGDATTQLLNTSGVFAVGFLMRPVGAWLFGCFADKHGRKTSMMVSVLMMCGSSLMVAFLPTYATIGTFAPLLLLAACLFQSLSLGGEYGISAAYMSEAALSTHRGFLVSFHYVTVVGGQLLAVLLLLILQQLLSDEELRAWGWRIPFVVGACGALIVLFLRRNLVETSSEETRRRKDAGTFAGLWKHKRAFLTVFVITAGGVLMFYTFTTYMQKYLVNTAGMSVGIVSIVMTGALLVCMLLQPLFGTLSDSIGRRNMMLCFGVSGTLFSMPVLHLLKDVTDPYVAFGLVILMLAIVSFYTSIGSLIKSEMFPSEVRALGVGLGHALGVCTFGGSAEFVALSFKSVGMESGFYWYVSVMCLIVLIVSLRMPDPGKAGYLKDEA
ncbi:MAG: MFS family transporter [Herbaspirillum sp.]